VDPTAVAHWVLLALDLLGVFAFALSGGLAAVRKGFDVVGSFLLAGMTGLGGGVVRDLIIGDQIPAAFDNPVYLAPPVAATALVYFFFPHVSRFRQTLLLFDAAGLGLFCVTGAVKALSFGAHPVTAVALGVTTAVGGGLMRDVVAREVPNLFRHDDIYALPAVAGAIIVTIVWSVDQLTWATGLGASVIAFLLRVVALWRGWRVPLAYAARHSIQS
jgi:uncharacterized membrane protein YeiH